MSIEKLYTCFLESSGICTDSRKITKDCFFVALKGERFDGNAFAEQAIRDGARYAVISDSRYRLDEHYLLVEDTLTTLQTLANHHRQQFDIPVLAITGSNGKTTTKELTHAVLATTFITHATTGNLNNHIGVPLTLLSMKPDTQLAIIEMGANHIGEIATLSNIAAPTHGLITNVGKAHLEGFGGVEGVRRAKSELYRYLAAHGGTTFVNNRRPELLELSAGMKQLVVYGEQVGNYTPHLLSTTPFVNLRCEAPQYPSVEISTQLFGEYNFDNLLTAIAVGLYFNVPPDAIKSALEAYTPSNNRSQIVQQQSNTFYLDAYNANPTSMKAALEHFAQLQASGKGIILGDMLELGDDSPLEHQRIIEHLQMLAQQDETLKTILLVGSAFGAFREQFSVQYFDTVSEAKAWFDKTHISDTHFLVKGSRSIQLEQLLK